MTNAPMWQGVPASDFVDGSCSRRIQILSVMFLFQGSVLPPLQRPVAPIQIWGQEPGQSGQQTNTFVPPCVAAPQRDAGWEDGRAGRDLDSTTTFRMETLSHFGALLAPRRASTPAGRQQWGPAAAGRPFVAIGVRVPNNCGCLPDGYTSCMMGGDAGLTPGITLDFEAQLQNNGLQGIKHVGQQKILYLILIQKLCVILLQILLSTAFLQPLSPKHL